MNFTYLSCNGADCVNFKRQLDHWLSRKGQGEEPPPNKKPYQLSACVLF